MTQSIPLVDLKAQLPRIRADIERRWSDLIDNTAFVMGPTLAGFESRFADYCEARHCAGVNSGTDAVEFALRAVGVGPGDEVILPANTFIATAVAVSRIGATAVLVDCDPVHHLIDVSQVEAAITPRTRALLPVHLYGQMAPMAPLVAIAERHGLAVVEDAAQAHGARQEGRRAGSLGDAAAFSFYPGKNLGAFGDGGAVVTRRDDVATALFELRNFGSTKKYEHPVMGFNSRLDPLQAVVLDVKLDHLDEWNAARQAAAARYRELLGSVDGLTLPEVRPDNEAIWHLYVVRVAQRDRVLSVLHEAGIGAGIHYPTPVHLHGAFADLGHGPGAFPVAEQACSEILSLPLYAELTPAQQDRVCNVLRGAL